MGDEKPAPGSENHPARADDDALKAKEEVAEAGHDTSGGDDADAGATGAGASGGAPADSDAAADAADSSATGAGPSGGATP